MIAKSHLQIQLYIKLLYIHDQQRAKSAVYFLYYILCRTPVSFLHAPSAVCVCGMCIKNKEGMLQDPGGWGSGIRGSVEGPWSSGSWEEVRNTHTHSVLTNLVSLWLNVKNCSNLSCAVQWTGQYRLKYSSRCVKSAPAALQHAVLSFSVHFIISKL